MKERGKDDVTTVFVKGGVYSGGVKLDTKRVSVAPNPPHIGAM